MEIADTILNKELSIFGNKVDFKKIKVSKFACHERWDFGYDYDDYHIYTDGSIHKCHERSIGDVQKFPVGTYDKIMGK